MVSNDGVSSSVKVHNESRVCHGRKAFCFFESQHQSVSFLRSRSSAVTLAKLGMDCATLAIPSIEQISVVPKESSAAIIGFILMNQVLRRHRCKYIRPLEETVFLAIQADVSLTKTRESGVQALVMFGSCSPVGQDTIRYVLHTKQVAYDFFDSVMEWLTKRR